ncbi:MAG: helix-turn-helix transcriptional regulator [Actinomycetota bacterium]
MVDGEVRSVVAGLVSAVRDRPTELPLAEIEAVRRTGHDVYVDRTGPTEVAYVTPRPDERLGRLSEREREVALLVAAGYSNRQIATALFIALSTVKDHMHAILAKTGLDSRAQLIAAYYGGLDRA